MQLQSSWHPGESRVINHQTKSLGGGEARSVLDQLRALEQQVEKRLRELAPLVAEYRDLEKVAERLGLKRSAPESSDAPAPKSAARVKHKPKPSRSPARTTRASKPRAS